MNWRKSKHSTHNGQCVEAASWRKSSRSMNAGNCAEIASWRATQHSGNIECVEAGQGQAVIGVRDSKLEEASPVLEFSPDAWRAFIREVISA